VEQLYKGPGKPLTVGVVVVANSAGVTVSRKPASYTFGCIPNHSPEKVKSDDNYYFQKPIAKPDTSTCYMTFYPKQISHA
jgi:hypothetical protein